MNPERSSSRLFRVKHWPSWVGLWLLRQISRLPYPALIWLGAVTGRLLWVIAPKHRSIARTNIALCFPDRPETEREQLLRKHFKALGLSLFEIGLSWWAEDHRLRPLLNVAGKEHLEEALEYGKGVLLLTAHFTTVEVSPRLISMVHPIDLTYRAGRDDPVGEHLRNQRDKLYEEAIPKGNVRAVLRRLKQNKVIWYAPDQGFGGNRRVYAEFFGIPTSSNPSTSRFVQLSGAKVVPYCLYRLPGRAGYQLKLFPALENFPGADLVEDTRRINKLFESFILEAPEQYLWVHKRFKFAPPGQQAPY